MKFDSIIFDIDGTIWDVREVVAKCWIDVISANTDWPITFDAQRLGGLFGKTMTEIFSTLYPGIPEDECYRIQQMIYAKQEVYIREYKPVLYEGFMETVQALSKRYELFIVTNAQKGYVETLFDVHDMKKYFKDWMCFGDTNEPKGVTIKMLMERNNLKNSVYVGDTDGDAKACRFAGIPMIFAAYGLGSVAEGEYIAAIDGPEELKRLLIRDTVLFDLDGTLLNSLYDLRDAVDYALRLENMPERTLEEIRNFVGNGVAKLMERSVVPGTTPEKCAQMLMNFKEYYKVHSMDNTRPYPGVLELMKRLRDDGYKIAVVSNKIDDAAKRLTAHFFDGLVDLTMGDHEGSRKKPAPDMVEEVLQILGSDKEHSVYVGDSQVDIYTAQNAGMDCILVEWGFRDRDYLESEGGKCFAKDASELDRLIRNGEGRA